MDVLGLTEAVLPRVKGGVIDDETLTWLGNQMTQQFYGFAPRRPRHG